MSMIKAPNSQNHTGIAMPTAFIRRITLASAGDGTQIQIQIVLKNLLRAASIMPDFLEHLKINVYQIRQGAKVNLKSLARRIYSIESDPKVDKKTISPFDYVGKDIPKEKRAFARAKDARGNGYEDYVYKAQFDVPEKDPSSLIYLTQVEIDMQAVAEKENIKSIDPSGRFTRICGKISGETVITNNKVKREAFFFTVDETGGRDPDKYQPGSVWAGAVHRHNKGYMAGAGHSKVPRPTLTRTPTVNPKIFDMRSTNSFEDKPFLFQSDQASDIFLPTDYRGNRIKHYRNKNYFSDPLITKNEQGGASVIFSFDHGGYIRGETRFRDLLSQKNDGAFGEYFPITNIQVVRHRVQTGDSKNLQSTNTLGTPKDTSTVLDEKSTIIMNADMPTSTTLGQSTQTNTNYTWPPPDKQGKNKIPNKKPVFTNVLERLPILPNGSIKTWALVDNEQGELNGGKHQYEVVITLEDRMIQLIQRISDDLNESIKNMRKYEESSILCGNYDPIHDRFYNSFKQRARKYGWSAAVSRFISALRTLYGSVDQEYINNLMVLTNPVTGTPTGITHVIGQMISLDSKVKAVLGDQTRPSSGRTKNVSVLRGSPKTIPKLQIRKRFDDIYDGNFSQNGISYLNENIDTKKQTEPTTTNKSTKQVSEKEYNNLITTQRKRFLVSGAPTALGTALGKLPKEIAVDKTTTNTFTSSIEKNQTLFLGPRTVRAGKKVLNLDDQSGGPDDLDKYALMTANLLDRSGQTNTLQEFKGENKNKELYQSIDNILKGEGITVDFDLLDRNKERDVVSETIGVSSGGNDKYFVESGDFLDNEQFNKKNIRNNKKKEYSVYEFEERNNLVTEIGKEMLSFLATDATLQDKNDPKEFGFRTSMKKLDPEKNPDLLSRSKIKKLFNLPIQTLSLIFGRSPVVRKNWLDLGVDLLQDGSYTEFYRYNYDMIVKVQYLDSYPRKDGQIQLRDPIWKDLNYNAYRKLVRSPRPTMCRLQPHEDIRFGIGQTKSLDVPIYNRYFVFRPSAGASLPAPAARDFHESFVVTADKFMDDKSPGIIDYFQTIVVDHADMFRAG